MAHNITIGDNVLATNQSTNSAVSAQHQIVQPAYGALGSAQIVTSSYPMPTCTYPVDGSGVALTPLFAVIDGATSGDNTIVAAVTSKKIRVLALHLTMTGTLVSIRFESGASGTALTGQMTPLAGNSITLPFNPVGWFETAAGVLLNMELGGAQSVDGMLVYVTLT